MRGTNESGRAITNPPSAVTIIPAGVFSPAGPSTVVKKLFGIPVVLLILGLSSQALSLFVGQS